MVEKFKRKSFVVHAFDSERTPVFKCTFLTENLCSVVEGYLDQLNQILKSKYMREVLPLHVREWKKDDIDEETIEKGKRDFEKSIDDSITLLKSERQQWAIEASAQYIEEVVRYAFEDAFHLLLEEARVAACHTDPAEPEEIADIVGMFKSYLKYRIGGRRNGKPRKRTAILADEAARLFKPRHERVRAAKKDHTTHKSSAAWKKHVAIEDQKRLGSPKLPAELISQLPFKPARELALEWTAQELNKRHENLGATAHTVRALVNADTKIGTPH